MEGKNALRRLPGLFLVFIFMIITAGCEAGTPTKKSTESVMNTPSASGSGVTVVSLTFDDGDADNFSARQLLLDHHIHATFYIISDFVGTDGYMTWDQLHTLYADGNEIGGHTTNHTNLITVSSADMRKVVCQNRVDLFAQGFQPVSFAYPYGGHDAEARQTVIDCGFNSARTVGGGPDSIPPADAFTLKAMPYVVKDAALRKLERYITQAQDAGGGWVILTLHHICDRCDEYAITMDNLKGLVGWLSSQKDIQVKTIGEVVGGNIKPAVQP
jgi:peptidoglycan/xylan/chitin deacetylase (PgdA/CDA1 family)